MTSLLWPHTLASDVSPNQILVLALGDLALWPLVHTQCLLSIIFPSSSSTFKGQALVDTGT